MRAIVTGASSGIGKAIHDHLKRTQKVVVGMSRRGPAHIVDFSNHIPLLSEFHADVLIINHGILSFDEEEDMDKLVSTNLTSYYRLLEQQARGHRPVREGGCIILNASVSGVLGEPDAPLYAALKAGVINLTRTYAKKLLPQKIRVNAFSCGFVKTDLVPGDTPQELIDTIPMGREAEAAEVIPIINMLIECHYMTGQNIIMDGGLSL